MSGEASDFNNMQTRVVLKDFSFQDKTSKEIHATLTETSVQHAPLYARVNNWVAQFKCGDFSTCDTPRAGRHIRVTTPEIIDQIHKIFLEKFHRKFTMVVSLLHDNDPANRALPIRKTPNYLTSQCPDHPPYSTDMGPSHYHLFPGQKNNWIVAIFVPTRRSLLPRGPGWTDRLLIIFWVACKVRATS